MPPTPTAALAAAKSAAPAATRAATRAAARGASRASPPPLPPSAADQKFKVKRMIWAGSFAAVIFMGTIYGAGLKTQQEWKASKRKVLEATVDEKVDMLEMHRAHLVRQKREVEEKLEELRAKMVANDEGEGSEGR